MKDEIKEIIDNIKKCCDIDKDANFVVYQKQDILKVLDYITNLQQKYECAIFIGKELNKDNERLKEELEITQQKWDKDKQFVECRTKEWLDYKSRNEKAIEYIELGLANEEEAEELLNILQGGDK